MAEWQTVLSTVIGYQYEFGVSDKDMIWLNQKYPDDTLSESQPHFSVKYSTKQKPGWLYVLDEVIQEGDSLPLSKNKAGFGPDSEGFLLSVVTSCGVYYSYGRYGGSFIGFSSDGPQFPGAFLRCTEKVVEASEKYNTYTLVLEFACNLYSDNRGIKLWRKLENGKLKVTFRVPK